MNGLDLDLFLRLVQTEFAAWILLGAVVLGLILTVWAGVGSHKALRKCLILSVVAHVLLMRYGQPVQWTQSGLGILGSSIQDVEAESPPLPVGIRSLEILDIVDGSESGSGLSNDALSSGSGNGRGLRNGILPSEISDQLPVLGSDSLEIQRLPATMPDLVLKERVRTEAPSLPEAPISETLPVDKPERESRQESAANPVPNDTDAMPLRETKPQELSAQERVESQLNASLPVARSAPTQPLPTPADTGRRVLPKEPMAKKPDGPVVKAVRPRPEIALPTIDIASGLADRLGSLNRPSPEMRLNKPVEDVAGSLTSPRSAEPADDLAPPVPVLENAVADSSTEAGLKTQTSKNQTGVSSRTSPTQMLPDRDLRSRIRNRESEKTKPAEVALNLPKPKAEVALPRPDLSQLSENSLLADRRNRPASRPIEAVPLVYRSRLDPNRAKLAIAAGASGASEKAVESALEWLSLHQDADGRWDAGLAKYRDGSIANSEDSFTVHCPPGDICFGECYYWEADTALTGLSLLAYLGAGYTHTDGKYSDTVGKGLDFLLKSQKPDGDLRGRSVAVGMYCHAMASLALCEAFALTGDERLRQPVSKAIAFLVDAQAENGAAWRYEPKAPIGDTSILGWVVLALRSGRSQGFPVPEKTVEGISQWLNGVSSGKNGGLAKYQPWKDVTPTMTAEAWLCRWFLDLDPNDGRNREASAYLLEHGPDRDPYNLYYWYYGTLAMYQNGGESWEKWNQLVRDRIVGKQKLKGHQTGSWDPDDSSWGKYGGRVYCTALATLTLEVYYRFLRLYENPEPPVQK